MNKPNSMVHNNITSKDIDKNNHSLNSIESKIWALIENNFAFSSFTSSNVAESYESLYQ